MPPHEPRRHLGLLIDAVAVRGAREQPLPERVLVLPFGCAREFPMRCHGAATEPFRWRNPALPPNYG